MKDTFLHYIANHYNELKQRFQAFCQNKHFDWDEDIFSDTILKCSEVIGKKGLEDKSDVGIENYFFKAFKTNIQREKQYSRNSKRDMNVGDVGVLYENWFNANNISSTEKLLKDLKTDYSALYLLHRIDEQYGSELCHLFTLKYYCSYTYKQLQNKFPNIPKLRDTLLNMKKWLMANVSKEEIQHSFEKKYDQLFGLQEF